MLDVLNSLAASPNAPWYLTAIVLFATTIYPILRRRFPALPDIYGWLQRLGNPSPVPLTPTPDLPLPDSQPEQFPLLSAALRLWFILNGKPVPQEITQVPPEALVQVGNEWDAVAKLLRDAHAEAGKKLAAAIPPTNAV